MTCAATDWLRTAKPRQEPGPGPTNLLEGGINKQLKDLAGNHRGMFDEHQRITMDWWLYVHTEDPVAPLELAKQQDFGRQGEKQHAPPGRKNNSNDAATQTGDQPHTTPTSTTNGTPA